MKFYRLLTRLTEDASSSSDEAYMDAVNRGDMKTAQRMVDKAAMNRPNKVDGYAYHYTRNKFTVFDNKIAIKKAYDDWDASLKARDDAWAKGEPAPEGIYNTDPGWTTQFGRGYVFPNDAHFFFLGKHPSENQIQTADRIKLKNHIYAKKVLDLTQPMSGPEFSNIAQWMQKTYSSLPSPGQAGHTVSGRYVGGFRRAKKEGVTPEQLFNFICGETLNTRSITWERLMKGLGYDAIKFYGNSSGTATLEPRRGRGDGDTYVVMAVFNSSQIKSADPVTYDDAGNVIPLSRRFNPNTTDIRESTDEDSEYMDAVKNGDMKTAQRIIDAAARNAGYNVGPVYHGTNENFTKVDLKKGAQGLFWFTSDRSSIESGESGAVGRSKILPLYVRIDRPAGWKEYERYGIGELRREGFDGVMLVDRDGTFNGFIFDDPSRIKSAEPVTHDSRGRIIPPSKRFNRSTMDIRESEDGLPPQWSMMRMPDGEWTQWDGDEWMGVKSQKDAMTVYRHQVDSRNDRVKIFNNDEDSITQQERAALLRTDLGVSPLDSSHWLNKPVGAEMTKGDRNRYDREQSAYQAKMEKLWNDMLSGKKTSTIRESGDADARYMELATDPGRNYIEMQRMVNAAAKDAGYTIGPVWHGTTKEFTVFEDRLGRRNGFYFSSDQGFAALFGHDEDHRQTEESRTMKCFLKMDKPFTDSDLNEMLKRKGKKTWQDEYGLPMDAFELNEREILLTVHAKGYDGVYIGNGGMAVSFDPAKIKSADIMTYDDAGNVIPLSRRFNPGKTDIRESQSSYDIDERYFAALKHGDMDEALSIIEYAERHRKPDHPEDIYYNFFDRENEANHWFVSTFRRFPEAQPWDVVPAARLTKIWNDYANSGVVRDVRGIDQIAETIVDNIARLQVNTIVAGHTQLDPEEYLEAYLDEDDPDPSATIAKMVDWIPDDRFSDYAMEPLIKDAIDIVGARTPEEKLIAIDRSLNRIHQRGELAKFFVEGGVGTLNRISGRPELQVVVKDESGKIIPPSVRFNMGGK